MAEDIDGALGIRATIDAADIQKGANDYIRAIQNMAKESDKAVNEMADGYGFLIEQLKTLSEAVEAARSKLTSISGAMFNIAPKDGADVQIYEDLKAQVNALTQVNDELKAKLSETTATISEQAKAADATTNSMKEFSEASNIVGNSSISSVSSKAKSEMKELAETIKFDTEQISLMQQEYEKLLATLDRLNSKKTRIENSPIQNDPLAQDAKDYKLSSVNKDIEVVQAKMSTIKSLTAEYKGEISQCSQRMTELGNQTAQTSTKTQALRTQLRNARQHVAEMILSGQQGTIEFGKAVNEANKLQAAFNKASMAINGKNLAFNSFNMLSTTINGVTGALTTYMGVAGLFTDNQEELAKIQKDLQSVMSISMGVQQLMTAATQISVKWDTLKASALAAVSAASVEATTAESGKAVVDGVETVAATAQTAANWTLATSFKAVSIAIKQIPVLGWILAAISALVAGGVALYKYFTKLTPAEEAAKDAAKAYGEQLKKNNETMLSQSQEIGNNVAKFKQLQHKYVEVKNDSQKLDNFIKDNKQSFIDLGFEVDNARDAENLFHKNTNAVIEAFRLRAKAAAQAKVATESYAKAYELQLEAEGWERSAKNGSMRHNKDDQEKARAKAKAMRNTAGRLCNKADKAINDSANTEDALNKLNKKNGLKSPSKENSKSDKKDKSNNNKNTNTNQKTQAEIDYENNKEWRELQIEEEKAFADKIKEYADRNLDIQEESANKSLIEIQRSRDEQMKALDEWIDELAKKRKQVAMNTWINAKEGRNEYQWSKTTEGKQTDDYWRKQVFNNADIKKAYDLNYQSIQNKAIADTQTLVDDTLSNYQSKQEKEKIERLKKLNNDILFLENQLTAIEDEAEKKRYKNALKNAQAQLDWVSQSKDAWNEYYNKYGTFLEKRAALEEKFLHDTQGLDKDSPEYKFKQKEYENASKALEFEEIKKQLNWEDVFGDLSRIGKSSLADLKKQLESLIENDKNLSIESIKTINEAINKVRSEQTKKGFLIGGMFDSIKTFKATSLKAKEARNQVERVAGGSLWRRYNNATTTEEKASVRNEQVYDPVTGKLVKFGDMLDRASKSAKEQTEAQKNATQSIKSVGNGFSTLSNVGKDVSSMLGKFGVTIPDGVGKMFEGFGEIGNAFEGFDLTKIGSFLDVGNYIHAVTGVFSGIADVFGGIFSIFGKGSGEKEYREELKHYNKLSDIWKDLIAKKQEYINLSFGDSAKKEIEDVLSLYKAEETSIKKLGIAYEKKRSWNAHSQGYRNDKSIDKKGGWKRWGELAGVTISSVNDFFTKDFTYEQLLNLKSADNGEFWASLDSETQSYLDKLIECKDGTEKFQETALEKLTGIKFDDMYSNFMSALSDMSKGADDFVQDFKNNMLKALIENTMGDEVKAWMDDYVKRYQAAVKSDGGKISEVNAQKFRQELAEVSNNFFNERQQIANSIGQGSAASSGEQKQGYATASEESIEELSGRALAQTEALYQIRDQQTLNAASINSIDSNLMQIVVIENKRTAYYDEALEIQRTSVSHLAAIEKNTNELFSMNEKLTKIEKNTRNI